MWLGPSSNCHAHVRSGTLCMTVKKANVYKFNSLVSGTLCVDTQETYVKTDGSNPQLLVCSSVDYRSIGFHI